MVRHPNIRPCPKCHQKQYEEISEGCVVVSEMIVDDDGLRYGEQTTDGGGEVVRYQCISCGYTVVDNEGDVIRDEDAFWDWLHKGGK